MGVLLSRVDRKLLALRRLRNPGFTELKCLLSLTNSTPRFYCCMELRRLSDRPLNELPSFQKHNSAVSVFPSLGASPPPVRRERVVPPQLPLHDRLPCPREPRPPRQQGEKGCDGGWRRRDEDSDRIQKGQEEEEEEQEEENRGDQQRRKQQQHR